MRHTVTHKYLELFSQVVRHTGFCLVYSKATEVGSHKRVLVFLSPCSKDNLSFLLSHRKGAKRLELQTSTLVFQASGEMKTLPSTGTRAGWISGARILPEQTPCLQGAGWISVLACSLGQVPLYNAGNVHGLCYFYWVLDITLP